MKTVLIQGALGGIGGAFVRALLSRPDVDRVVATGRDSELRPELLATRRPTPNGFSTCGSELPKRPGVSRAIWVPDEPQL